jgi:hypothetical protein
MISKKLCDTKRIRDGAVGWGTTLQTGRSWARFPKVSLELIDVILPPTLWLRGRLNVWKKRVPCVSPRGKGGRCVGLTTLPPPMCPMSWKLGSSTSWNPLGLCGPVQGLRHVTWNPSNLRWSQEPQLWIYTLFHKKLDKIKLHTVKYQNIMFTSKRKIS